MLFFCSLKTLFWFIFSGDNPRQPLDCKALRMHGFQSDRLAPITNAYIPNTHIQLRIWCCIYGDFNNSLLFVTNFVNLSWMTLFSGLVIRSLWLFSDFSCTSAIMLASISSRIQWYRTPMCLWYQCCAPYADKPTQPLDSLTRNVNVVMNRA